MAVSSYPPWLRVPISWRANFDRVPRGNLTRSPQIFSAAIPPESAARLLRIKLIHRPLAQIYSTVNPASRMKLSSFCRIEMPCSIQFAIFENKAQTLTYNAAGLSMYFNEREREKEREGGREMERTIQFPRDPIIIMIIFRHRIAAKWLSPQSDICTRHINSSSTLV